MYKLDGIIYASVNDMMELTGATMEQMEKVQKRISRCPRMEKACKLVNKSRMLPGDINQYREFKSMIRAMSSIIKSVDLIEKIIMEDRLNGLSFEHYVESSGWGVDRKDGFTLDIFYVIRADCVKQTKEKYINFNQLSEYLPVLLKLLPVNEPPFEEYVMLPARHYRNPITLVNAESLMIWIKEKYFGSLWCNVKHIEQLEQGIKILNTVIEIHDTPDDKNEKPGKEEKAEK